MWISVSIMLFTLLSFSIIGNLMQFHIYKEKLQFIKDRHKEAMKQKRNFGKLVNCLEKTNITMIEFIRSTKNTLQIGKCILRHNKNKKK